MKKLLSFALAAGILFLAGCGQNKSGQSAASSEPVSLTVAAAASLTDVTKEIAADYKKVQPNAALTFTYASSGALQTQIEQGAPVDVFMSAAAKQMDALDKESLIVTGTRKNLLENKLVLITPKSSALGIKSFSDLSGDKVKTIALGDPKSVPAGQYAQQVFTSLNSWDQVKAKANLGTDVRQVLTWVESGNVDCGVVYATDAATSKNITVVCEAPAGSCDPVIYPAAVIKSSKQAAAAESFIKYMQTKRAVSIFEKYGFTMAK